MRIKVRLQLRELEKLSPKLIIVSDTQGILDKIVEE